MNASISPVFKKPLNRTQETRRTIGLQFSAEHFPASPAFAHFLHYATTGEHAFDTLHDWGNQVTESLWRNRDNSPEHRAMVQSMVNQAINTPLGRNLATKAYNLFGDFLVGNPNALMNLRQSHRHIFVVSAPRHGGSYLTKELLRATGIDPLSVPVYMGHDGYPSARPDWYVNHDDESVPMTRRTMQQTAEWMVMAHWFFRDNRPVDGMPTIVKKGLKMVYAAPFFRGTFGPQSEWVVAVRHPAASCISTYEKSGGLPKDGLFPKSPRSTIEHWIMDSWTFEGVTPEQVSTKSYFSAYLHYWIRYHQWMATGGLFANNRHLTILAYHPDIMESFIRKQRERFGASDLFPEKFLAKPRAALEHPDWISEAAAPIQDMQTLWRSFGVEFPSHILSEAY